MDVHPFRGGHGSEVTPPVSPKKFQRGDLRAPAQGVHGVGGDQKMTHLHFFEKGLEFSWNCAVKVKK